MGNSQRLIGLESEKLHEGPFCVGNSGNLTAHYYRFACIKPNQNKT